MSPELTTKVRLVRCPKCRRFLAELPDIPVYKCGGCGVTLQAKSRINGLRSKSASLNDTVAAQRISFDHAYEDKKSRSSGRIATLPESGECSSDQDNERDRSKSSEDNESSTSSTPKATYPESGSCFSNQNTEKNEGKPSEEKISSSSSHNTALPDQNNERDQSKSSEGNESSSLSPKATFPGECFSDQNNVKDQIKSSEGNEFSSSSPTATFPDSRECLPDLNNERDMSESSEGNEFSSSSPEATFPDSGKCFKSSEDREFGSSNHRATLPDSGECTSDQTSTKGPDESSEDCGREQVGDINVPNEDQKNQSDRNDSRDFDSEQLEVSNELTEFARDEVKETLPKTRKGAEVSTNDESSPLGEANVDVDINKEIESDFQSSNNVNPGDARGSSSIVTAHATARESISSDSFKSSPNEQQEEPQNSVPNGFDHVRSPDAFENIVTAHKPARESVSSDSLASSPNEQQEEPQNSVPNGFDHVRSPDADAFENIVTAHKPARESVSSDSLTSSPNEQQEEPQNSVPNGFDHVRSPDAFENIVTAHKPARESVSSDSLTSSPNEQLEEPQNSAFPNGFGHVRSPDAFENTEFFPSFELSSTPRDLSKSPANRSHHAYDASVSSYDGMDDQFFNRNTRSNIVHSEERIRRDKFMANSMMTRDSGLQHQARGPWSNLPVKNDRAMKYRKWDQDALLPPRRQGHPSQDWNRLQSDEYMSRMAFPRRVSQRGYENGGPTSQLHNEYQHNSGYQSSEKSVEAEQDKMTLLRMVYELQDQVNNLNEKASGRVAGGSTWKEKRVPQYCGSEASEEELFQDPNYLRYLRRHRAGSHYPPQHHHKNMRIPFSSEATTSRHQADSSYLHYGPQDWQCSAPLPQPVPCTHNGLCRVHPGHSCWTSYDKSRPSTPERYVESGFHLWGHETMSADLRHQRHDVKKLYGEKQHLTKRHFRPIAGGAPIIACYNCSKLLQIPADFLLFKRRYHRLRCGACSEVLRFSLQKRSHFVPYEQNTIAPPPSEVGDYNAAANGGNLASRSHHADPVSCSDDYGYGPSYYSYSTDGDPGALAPSNSPQADTEDRNMSSSSLDPMRERKELVLRQSQNKDKNPIETFVSARPSSSEIEELPAKSSSPLHRLMGYASPSQVIRGSGSSQTGRSSYPLQR